RLCLVIVDHAGIWIEGTQSVAIVPQIDVVVRTGFGPTAAQRRGKAAAELGFDLTESSDIEIGRRALERIGGVLIKIARVGYWVVTNARPHGNPELIGITPAVIVFLEIHAAYPGDRLIISRDEVELLRHDGLVDVVIERPVVGTP